MKRTVLTIVAILTTSLTFASGGGLPFNHHDRTLGQNDIRRGLMEVANAQPNVHALYAKAFGDQNWNNLANLRVGERRHLTPGTKFTNSYLDSKGRIFQSPSTAKSSVELVQVICISTNTSVWVKRDCLNLAGKAVLGAAVVPREVEQVVNVSQALNLDLEINVRVDVSASASAVASTAPITNTMVMYVPQQQPIYMIGATPLQFMRVERPGVQIGVAYFWTRPSNINITNVNMNSNTNINKNNNTNSNSNVNNNTVNVGGGCG